MLKTLESSCVRKPERKRSEIDETRPATAYPEIKIAPNTLISVYSHF